MNLLLPNFQVTRKLKELGLTAEELKEVSEVTLNLGAKKLFDMMDLDVTCRTRTYCRSVLQAAILTSCINAQWQKRGLRRYQEWMHDTFLRFVAGGEPYSYADVVVFAMYKGGFFDLPPVDLMDVVIGLVSHIRGDTKFFSTFVKTKEKKEVFDKELRNHKLGSEFQVKVLAKHVHPFNHYKKRGFWVTF